MMASGFFVLLEILKINEIDRNAIHIGGYTGSVTLRKFHTRQSGQYIDSSGGIAQLNDLVRYHKIGCFQIKGTKSELIECFDHPGGIFSCHLHPNIHIFSIAWIPMQRDGIAPTTR